MFMFIFFLSRARPRNLKIKKKSKLNLLFDFQKYIHSIGNLADRVTIVYIPSRISSYFIENFEKVRKREYDCRVNVVCIVVMFC